VFFKLAAGALLIVAAAQSQVHRDIYPAIDLATYVAKDGSPEYDWIVHPGADPSRIRMHFPFADDLSIDPAGDLVIKNDNVTIRHTRPIVYQDTRSVAASFRVIDAHTVSFTVSPYDHSRTLVIDPRIAMGASFGGSGSRWVAGTLAYVFYADAGMSVALDPQGNVYVAGNTYSLNFPLVNPLPPASISCPSPNTDSTSCAVAGRFIAKLDPSGRQLLYSTLLGNPTIVSAGYTSQQANIPIAMAVDREGNAYVTGAVGAFAEKLDPAGNLLWSQNLGGLSGIIGTAIALEPSGKVAITGTTQTANLPVTANALRTTSSVPANIFLTELDSASGNLTYATYLGGSATNPQVTASPDGAVVIAASTSSSDWPITPGVVQPNYTTSPNYPSATTNAILMKLNTSSSQLVWATFLGENSVNPSAIVTGPGGDVFVTGMGQVAATEGAVATPGGCSQFLTRLNSTASSLIYSACTGGKQIAVDSEGNAFVTGNSLPTPAVRAIQSTPIWTTCPAYGFENPIEIGTALGEKPCISGGSVAALNPTGDAFLWSTFLGTGTVNGLTVDASGNVLVTGNNLLLDPQRIAGSTDSVSVVKIAPDGEPLGLALTNAASFAPGFPSPGGLASLFVTGMNDATDVQVLVGGEPAANSYASPQQINFQVPYGSHPSWIEVQYQGMSTFASGPPVAGGIFTAIQHAADFSIVTPANPITAGETILIYGTGFGAISTAGTFAPADSVSVSIGKSSCTTLYAAAAPGVVGVDEISCRVGQDVQSGSQPLQVAYDQYRFYAPPVYAYTHSNIVMVPVQSVP
jgi:uncharacterized protein (TIGR03437 family)